MTATTIHQLLHMPRPQPAKPEPTRLVDGMKWNSAATHNTSDAFRARQIARGLKVRNP
jgi:hypothetical protein